MLGRLKTIVDLLESCEEVSIAHAGGAFEGARNGVCAQLEAARSVATEIIEVASGGGQKYGVGDAFGESGFGASSSGRPGGRGSDPASTSSLCELSADASALRPAFALTPRWLASSVPPPRLTGDEDAATLRDDLSLPDDGAILEDFAFPPSPTPATGPKIAPAAAVNPIVPKLDLSFGLKLKAASAPTQSDGTFCPSSSLRPHGGDDEADEDGPEDGDDGYSLSLSDSDGLSDVPSELEGLKLPVKSIPPSLDHGIASQNETSLRVCSPNANPPVTSDASNPSMPVTLSRPVWQSPLDSSTRWRPIRSARRHLWLKRGAFAGVQSRDQSTDLMTETRSREEMLMKRSPMKDSQAEEEDREGDEENEGGERIGKGAERRGEGQSEEDDNTQEARFFTAREVLSSRDAAIPVSGDWNRQSLSEFQTLIDVIELKGRRLKDIIANVSQSLEQQGVDRSRLERQLQTLDSQKQRLESLLEEVERNAQVPAQKTNASVTASINASISRLSTSEEVDRMSNPRNVGALEAVPREILEPHAQDRIGRQRLVARPTLEAVPRPDHIPFSEPEADAESQSVFPPEIEAPANTAKSQLPLQLSRGLDQCMGTQHEAEDEAENEDEDEGGDNESTRPTSPVGREVTQVRQTHIGTPHEGGREKPSKDAEQPSTLRWKLGTPIEDLRGHERDSQLISSSENFLYSLCSVCRALCDTQYPTNVLSQTAERTTDRAVSPLYPLLIEKMIGTSPNIASTFGARHRGSPGHSPRVMKQIEVYLHAQSADAPCPLCRMTAEEALAAIEEASAAFANKSSRCLTWTDVVQLERLSPLQLPSFWWLRRFLPFHVSLQ